MSLLSPLLKNESEQQALLTLALGRDATILGQIKFGGQVEVFTLNMVNKLLDFGEIEPGKQALWALLEVARDRVGVDRQARIDALRPLFSGADASAEISELQNQSSNNLRLPVRGPQDVLVNQMLQHLTDPNYPGVALMEPLNFGARDLANYVVETLKDPSRNMLVIRLVPRPNTRDEQRLYRALYRNLVQGLQHEFGRPLPALWGDCLSDEQKIDGDGFRELLEDLLYGPVADTQRTLVLAVDGLARVAEEHLEQWAYLMSSLAEDINTSLKLLVWGGEELHALCRGAKFVGFFSPFHRLKDLKVGPFSKDEVKRRMHDKLGHVYGTQALYALTEGHPALVAECLEHPSPELLSNDQNGLCLRILNTSTHLRILNGKLNNNAAADAVLQRLLAGDDQRHPDDDEDYLYWLGILKEHEQADRWQWAAPILEDWARQ